jgi:hypothetical protein
LQISQLLRLTKKKKKINYAYVLLSSTVDTMVPVFFVWNTGMPDANFGSIINRLLYGTGPSTFQNWQYCMKNTGTGTVPFKNPFCKAIKTLIGRWKKHACG